MKRLFCLFVLVSFLNATVYPYTVAKTAPKPAVKTPKKRALSPSRSVALSRSAKDVRVLWNKEAFTGATHLEIVREPAFMDGNKIVRADRASYIDRDVTDGKEYKYTINMVDKNGKKTAVKTMKAWFGSRSGTALSGEKSRVDYDGFHLAFKGTEFRKHKKVTVRISPNTVEEDALIQASDLYEVTLEDEEQPANPVTAEIDYNTINMPQGYSEKDLKVFLRHNVRSKWEKAKIVNIDTTNKVVTTAIPHFSEIMAGFIGAPSESQTRANVNTALPKIKLQDPFAGKMRIAPPQPNISGALGQSIPIVLPSGKAGMTPDVSLVYSSDQKNGLVGYGWALAAGDSISYVKKNGTYIFAAGGGELVFHSAQGSVSNFYLKYENSFVRYEYHSGSDIWEVIKDGQTNLYGENSMRLTNNLPGLSSKQWLLTGKVSPNNIAVDYYYGWTTGDELVLTNITYDHFKVNFCWQDRSDPFSYTGAFGYYTMKERLTNIQLMSDMDENGYYQLEKQYVLSYLANDAGNPLLTNVELKTPDNISLSKIDLTYKTNDFVNSIQTNAQFWNTNSTIAEDRQNLMPMDINGDGLQDIVVPMDGLTNTKTYGKFKVYTNSSMSFTAMPSYWGILEGGTNINDFPMDRVRFMDMNGDGLPDITANFSAYPNGTEQGIWKVYTNSGSGFVYASGYILSNDIDPSRFSIIDMNGDGRPDFVLNKTGLDGDGIVYAAYTNSGNGIAANVVNWQYSTAVDPASTALNDLTGDGLPDLLIQDDTDSATGFKVYRNTGSNFNTSSYYTFSIPKTDPQFTMFLDINGDGMQELVADSTITTNNGTNKILYVYRNNGTSLTNTPETWIIPVTDPYGMNFRDMNGDGRPDIVVSYQDTTLKTDIWLNTNGGFVFKGTADLQGTIPESQSLVDINSDGAPDSVVNNDDGSLTVYKGKQNFNYLLNTMEASHLVITYEYGNVNNGLGYPKTVLVKAVVSNELPSTDPGFYSKDTYYTYKQGKYDRLNRVMYGFGKIEASDAAGNKSAAYYDQTAEFMIGRTLTNESYAGPSQKLVSRSINSYTSMSVNGGISTNVLLTAAVDIVKSLDEKESQTNKTEYKYYGLDYSLSGEAANNYGLLYKKINRGTVTGADYSVNSVPLDDVYQEYAYTPDNYSANITPKVCSSETYMTNSSLNKDRLGLTQYYFKSASGFGYIGTSELVAMKKEWNGTSGGQDKWLISVNRYDSADAWRLTGTTLSNITAQTNQQVKTTDYFYDSTKRFVTMTSNTFGLTEKPDENIVETSQSVIESVWGLPLKTIDNNGQTNNYRYDIWERPIAVYVPGDHFNTGISQTGLNNINDFNNNSSDAASTLYVYEDGDYNTTVTKAYKRLNRNTDGFIESIAFLDGFGRTLQTKISRKNPTSGAKDYVVSGKTKYDALGRVVESNDPIASSEDLETYHLYNINYTKNPVSAVYDDLGRTVTNIKAQITNTTLYDGLYRTVSTDPEGNKSETVKDSYGRVKKVIDYINKTTNNTYAVIDYAYDYRGNLTNTKDISNNVISIAYDNLNRKTSMTDPDMGYWTYQYDDLGRLIMTVDAKDQTNHSVYDAAGRLTGKTFEGGEAPDVSYSYGTDRAQNNNGRLVSISDGSGSESYVYNERGEATSITKTIDSTSYISEYSYDALGRAATLVYPHTSGGTVIKLKYSYEEYSGLLDKIEQIDPSTEAVLKTFLSDIKYDEYGRRMEVDYGNGISTTYTYNSVTSLLDNCLIKKDAATLKDIDYTFDKVGNLLVKDDTLEARTEYTYDGLYRLTNSVFTAYAGGPQGSDYSQGNTYNALGNILGKDVSGSTGNRNYQYSTVKPHAVISFTGTYQGDNSAAYAFQYDANGNMTNQTITYNSGTQTAVKTFAWDGENRLTALTWDGSAWAYTYDSSGERVKKQKDSGDTTYYVNGMAQFRSSGSEVYAVFDGVNRIVSISKTAEETAIYYLNTDHIGSTSLVTKEDGTAYKKLIYRSFGEIHKAWDSSGWHSLNPGELSDIGSYAFTGQELDGETGLYYYGARYYDPNIGRFISADTVVQDPYDTQTYGRYTYCRNNPVNYNDPSGHLFGIDDLFISIVATIVNTVNNKAFTPTLCYNGGFFNASVAYNTGNGSTTVSAGIGGFGLGLNASLTLDKNGCFEKGSVGLSYGFDLGGGFNAGASVSANFGKWGIYTGTTLGLNTGYGKNGGIFSNGIVANGSVTINPDGTTGWGAGAGVNGSYGGYGVSGLGANYDSQSGWSMTGSGIYDKEQANKYDELTKTVTKTQDVANQSQAPDPNAELIRQGNERYCNPDDKMIPDIIFIEYGDLNDNGESSFRSNITINGQTFEDAGSTYPSPTKNGQSAHAVLGQLSEGKYRYEVINDPKPQIRGSKSILINDGLQLPCDWPNNNHNGQKIVTQVMFHRGHSETSRGSAACLTVKYSMYNQVLHDNSYLPIGHTGYIQVIRINP